jgi:hypothetical protein
MSSFMKRPVRWVALVGLALLAAPATTAHAQPQMNVGPGMTPAQFGNPGGAGRIMSLPAVGGFGGVAPTQPFVPSYNPYGSFDPFGGALQGQASLTSAQGQFLVSQQQAYLQRENVRAAHTDNRRRTFDEYMYEKEHTPSAEEERQRAQKEYLARARNSPPSVEIWSGSALNILLQDLRKGVGVTDPSTNPTFTMPLDEDILKHINVTSGRGDGNAGLLKNGAKLSWPDALSGPEYKDERERIGSGIADALKQAEFNNKVDGGTVNQLRKDVDSLGRQLKRNIADVGVNDYIEAKGFLNNLDSSIVILKQPDAGNYLNGKYDLKAKSVGDLVKNMTEKGLTFASAVPGDESAYNALYQAMANYDNLLHATPSSNP